MQLFFVVLVLVLVVGVVSFFVTQQRVRDMRTFAAAHALTYMGSSWDLGSCFFSLFLSGNRRYWRNVLRGSWGRMPVTYCDYTYVQQEGKSSASYSFSCVLTPLGMQMPQVSVSPRSALGAFAERSIGAPGIRFESIDFNDRFNVQSNDQAFAVELIDAQMIETLLGLDHGLHAVFGPEYLMLYRHRQPVSAIGAIFDATSTVSQRIPALVRARPVTPSEREQPAV
ncbi:MAG: DUF3137 domain-containing protein [Candidatus Dormiibacterota bacterium]